MLLFVSLVPGSSHQNDSHLLTMSFSFQCPMEKPIGLWCRQGSRSRDGYRFEEENSPVESTTDRSTASAVHDELLAHEEVYMADDRRKKPSTCDYGPETTEILPREVRQEDPVLVTNYTMRLERWAQPKRVRWVDTRSTQNPPPHALCQTLDNGVLPLCRYSRYGTRMPVYNGADAS